SEKHGGNVRYTLSHGSPIIDSTRSRSGRTDGRQAGDLDTNVFRWRSSNCSVSPRRLTARLCRRLLWIRISLPPGKERAMNQKFSPIVDGKPASVEADPAMPLLYVLRDDLGLSNPKFGCGKAQCGACTVHLDGAPVRSCVLPVSAAAGKRVTTLTGLGTAEKP